MKKKSKYGRNPKLNPKTHCVMVRFDDEEWNRFLTMYEESNVYAKQGKRTIVNYLITSIYLFFSKLI